MFVTRNDYAYYELDSAVRTKHSATLLAKNTDPYNEHNSWREVYKPYSSLDR